MPTLKCLFSYLLVALLPLVAAAPVSNIQFTVPDRIAAGKNLQFSYAITPISNAPDAMLVALHVNTMKLSFANGTKVTDELESRMNFTTSPGTHQGLVELAWPALDVGNYTLQYTFQLDGLKGNPGPYTTKAEVPVPFAGSKLQALSAVGPKETSLAMVVVAAALGAAIIIL